MYISFKYKKILFLYLGPLNESLNIIKLIWMNYLMKQRQLILDLSNTSILISSQTQLASLIEATSSYNKRNRKPHPDCHGL